MNENLFDTGVGSGMSTPIPDVGGLDVNLMQPFMDTASSQPDFGCTGGQSQEATDSTGSIWASPSVEDGDLAQGGHSPTFCGSRESTMKDLRQAQSDVAYYTKEVQHNISELVMQLSQPHTISCVRPV